MADEKKADVVDDIDAPVAIKSTSAINRVGVSAKGLGIAALIGTALVFVVGIGIMNAGPSGINQSSSKSTDALDMPGQSQAVNVAKIAAEVEARRQAEQAQDASSSDGGLQVRGQGQTPATATISGGPNAQAQMSPREQHETWLEKKKYERIQGKILAADAALTADLAKNGGVSSGGGGIRPVVSGEDMNTNPLARLAGIRNAAHANAAAGQVPAMLATGANPAAGSQAGLLATGGDPNVAAQLRNREFLKEAAEAGYLPETVKPRMGRHELAAGSIIPAVMLTGINSDLPGIITAQVRQSIYDTFDESTLIVPQGTRIIGRYSSQVAYGQDRVLVAWDEMIMPNGNRVNLRGMSGADGLGQAGFNDQVDRHFFRIWGSALMVSMLGVGVQLSQPQNSSVNNSPSASQQAAGAAANSLNQAGSKVLEKNMNISPTLTIRPGYTFNVIVNKSVVLPAYRD